MTSGEKPAVLRCGPLEIDLADAEIRRHGIRVKLQEKPFQLLATLVERPGAVVTREELRTKLWSGNTYMDFERSLNIAMSKLRLALGESKENPRYVETVRGRGYRFIGPVVGLNDESTIRENPPTIEAGPEPSAKRRLDWRWAIAILCLTTAGSAAYLVFKPATQIGVSEYVRITHDGHPKQGPLMTDGSNIYYLDRRGGRKILNRISPFGGEPTPVLSFDVGEIVGMAPHRPEVLVLSPGGPGVESALLVYPLPFGSPRRLGDFVAHAATWSPDGAKLLYANNSDLFMANNDGSQSRKLISLPARVVDLRWSPDARHIRLLVFANGIWECAQDGTGLHQLQTFQAGAVADVGAWTPDGRYYLLPLIHNGRSDMWALRGTGTTPLRITTGQLGFSTPVTIAEGRRVLAIGTLERTEFVRYDSKSRGFIPYLSGISANSMAISPDNVWIIYSSYPDQTLWRSRVDGSERVQLTSSPDAIALPRWSPDGKRIAFMSRQPGGPWKIYSMASSGGSAEQLVPGDQNAGHPSWSPDGRTLVFAGTPWEHAFAPHSTAIHLMDIATRAITTLPASDGLWAPRWSPDGKFLVAETLDSRNLETYEFSTRTWSKLASTGDAMIGYSSWSSDSKFVYYNAYASGAGKIYRAGIASRRPEAVLTLNDLDEAETMGRYFTLGPNDTPILLRDTSISEIYSLNLQLP